MSKLYRPASGSEGLDFQNHWCCRCRNYNRGTVELPDPDCSILADSFAGPVAEWIYSPDGEPTCTAFILAAPEPTEEQRLRQQGMPDLFGGGE